MPFWSLLEWTGGTPRARLGMFLWSLSERTGGTPRAPWDASRTPPTRALECLSEPSQRGPAAGPHARLGMPLWSPLERSGGTPHAPWMPLWDAFLEPLKEDRRDPTHALGCLSGASQRGPHARLEPLREDWRDPTRALGCFFGAPRNPRNPLIKPPKP